MAVKKNDLCGQAEKFIFAGDYKRALAKAQRANKLRDERAPRLLVWIYRMMGKPAQALRYLKTLPEDADRLCEEAILYRMLCDFKTARKKISSALRIYSARRDREGMAFASWTRGGIERYGGNPGKAFFYFRKALPLTDEKSAKAYVLCGIGGSARLLGDYALSEQCYASANKVFSGRKEKFGIAYSFCGLGSAARMKKDFKKSEKLYKKAVSIYKKINDRWNMAYSMWGLAQTLYFIGDKKDAFKINADCVKIFREFTDPRGIFYCALQEANFLRMASEFRKAAAAVKKSAGVPEKLSLAYEAKLLKEQRRLISSKDPTELLIA